MRRIKYDFYRGQRGAGMLDIILSLGIAAIVAPFIYAKIAGLHRDLEYNAAAEFVVGAHDAASNFVIEHGCNANGFKMPGENKLVAFDLAQSLMRGDICEVSVKFSGIDINKIAVGKIAEIAGADLGADGKLEYRVAVPLRRQAESKFLHRTDYKGLNEMQRDLIMAKNSITNAGDLYAKTAKFQTVSAAAVSSDAILTDEILFANGAVMNPSAVVMKNIRVIGDIIGFRNIAVEKMSGINARVIADRANVTEKLDVANDLNAGTDTHRTATDFASVAAGDLALANITVRDLRFAAGHGITIPIDFLRSYSDVPLTLGAWRFPGAAAPKFNILTIRDFDVAAFAAAANTDEFAKITDGGWKNAPSK